MNITFKLKEKIVTGSEYIIIGGKVIGEIEPHVRDQYDSTIPGIVKEPGYRAGIWFEGCLYIIGYGFTREEAIADVLNDATKRVEAIRVAVDRLRREIGG